MGAGYGIASALAQGLGGWEEGRDEAQRKMLALAAKRRAQQEKDEERELRRLAALREAAEAGLLVSPAGSSRSGDTPPTTNPTGPSISSEAGPASKADPTPVATVGGHTIAIPPNLEPKNVRDRRAMIAAGLEKPPAQTLPERIAELRKGGMKPEEAVRNARLEFGHPDPVDTRRRMDELGPRPSSRQEGATPDKRAEFILRRAPELQKPSTDPVTGVPVRGMSRDAAEAQAGEEYDRAYGHSRRGSTAPGPDRAGAPRGMAGMRNAPAPPNRGTKTTQPTAGAGGAGDKAAEKTATPQQAARAAVDTAYASFLRAKGLKLPSR